MTIEGEEHQIPRVVLKEKQGRKRPVGGSDIQDPPPRPDPSLQLFNNRPVVVVVGPPAPVPGRVAVPKIDLGRIRIRDLAHLLESQNKKAMKTHLPGGAFMAFFYLEPYRPTFLDRWLIKLFLGPSRVDLRTRTPLGFHTKKTRSSRAVCATKRSFISYLFSSQIFF